jgi:hypothetical protein
MELLAALYTELSASTNGIAAFTSNRIYPNIAAYNVKKPYLVTHIISNPYIGHTNQKDIKLYQPMVSVNIWSSGYPQVRSIAAKVQTALQDFRGTMGGAGGITVQRSFLEDEVELPEVDPQTFRPEYRIVQDYTIWYST